MNVRALSSFSSPGKLALMLALALAFLVLPGLAAEAGAAKGEAADAKITLNPQVKGGSALITKKVKITGALAPFRNGQKVRVYLYKDGKKIATRQVAVRKAGANYGRFETSVYMRNGYRYGVNAKYWGKTGPRAVRRAQSAHKSWKVRYPGIRKRECGRIVGEFRKALNRLALVPGKGRCVTGKTRRAVLAYRKLNDMPRNFGASPTIVRRVFNGVGGYKVRRPGLGHHVEAPLSKQLMIFAKGKKPYAIFPIASGARATPTILGTYRFYRKDPGYNAIGMYYSSYFIRGYASHGYKSVPNQPASHGCLRTFIADQPRVYNLTKIGMPVYTFGNAFRGKVAGYKVRETGSDLGPDLGPTGGLDPTRFD